MSRNEGPVGQIQTDGPGALATDRTTQAAVAALPHIPALDGLRGVAIIMVMLFHARVPGFSGGYLGVDVFFVLSGFLITSILLEEQSRHGQIAYGRFVLRRMTRLMPGLLTFLAAYLAVAPWAWPDIHNHATQALISVLYLADYTVALWEMPLQIGHIWSLSVEEHFYLFWPLILLFVRPSAQKLRRGLIIAWLLAIVWRSVCLNVGQSWNEVYFRFDTRLSGLILGASLAAWRRAGAGVRLPDWAGMVALICLGVLAQLPWGWPPAMVWGVIGIELATGVLILVLLNSGSAASQVLSAAPLVATGRISYGLYLWHYPIFVYLRAEQHWAVVLLVGGGLSFAVAALSFVTVERWGMSLRNPGGWSRRFAQAMGRIADDTRKD